MQSKSFDGHAPNRFDAAIEKIAKKIDASLEPISDSPANDQYHIETASDHLRNVIAARNQ